MARNCCSKNCSYPFIGLVVYNIAAAGGGRSGVAIFLYKVSSLESFALLVCLIGCLFAHLFV